jgi:isoquinoline 1-oxidoreductase subunit alpha
VTPPMPISVNGQIHQLADGPDGNLLGWLRSVPGLTGAKPGCGEGACGACTVLIDGDPVLACQSPVAAAAGATVTTIEGLARGGSLHPAQQALMEEQAMQCGYCTPGVALRIAALIDRHPDPDHDQIVSALQPGLCRCGCYPSIVRAVHRAVQLARLVGASDPRTIGAQAEPGDLPQVSRPWDLSATEDRDYFEVLGPGLMFVWPPTPPAPGMWPAGGGAWMHLGGDGEVTAFSGKVNVGQGNTTALRTLVAEELDTPPSEPSMVQPVAASTTADWPPAKRD